MEALEVGIREFREKLSDYVLHSGKPLAVTRHGATVGYFIPTRQERDVDKVRALREAGAAVDAMIKQARITETDIESMVAEFDTVRRAKSRSRKA